MNMPGFAAESSLCQTNNRYGSAGGSFPNNSNPTVAPQGCGLVDAIVCGGLVVAVSGVCLGVCVAAAPLGIPGAAICVACAVGVVGSTALIACHDCLPDVISNAIDITRSQGGNGGPPPPPPCCPASRPICCGSCASGTCDDVCIRRGQSCP
jgi:hypothetical protein